MSTFAKEPTLLEFSQKFLRGKVLEPPQILIGGALHQNWKVVTDQGSYVIKEINPAIAIKPDVIKNYEASETIAHEFAEIGLPAVAAIKIGSCFIHSFQESLYIIYPFVKGHVLPAEKIEKSHATIFGSIFKTMHISKLNTCQTLPHYDLFSNTHWTRIIQNSNEPNLIKLLPSILTWNDLYHSAIPKLNETIVISHRDLHYSNILWDGLTPSIIDWESAGPTNPLQEVLGFALEWSGIIASQFNKEIFQTIIKTYSPRDLTFQKEAFYGWLGNSVLGWIEFNIRRAFNKDFSVTEQARGQSILKNKMIPCLAFIEKHLSELNFQ